MNIEISIMTVNMKSEGLLMGSRMMTLMILRDVEQMTMIVILNIVTVVKEDMVVLMMILNTVVVKEDMMTIMSTRMPTTESSLKKNGL